MAWDRGKYLGNLFYDVAKAAIIRMSYGMAEELRMHGVAALALAPGFVRTERVMAAHALQPFSSGEVLAAGDLAQEYDFVDVDGKRRRRSGLMRRWEG